MKCASALLLEITFVLGDFILNDGAVIVEDLSFGLLLELVMVFDLLLG